MSRLEASIEKAVGQRLEKWLHLRGWAALYLKLNVLGMRGFPDRLILFRNGQALFVEFKRAGEEPRKLQLYVHKVLEAMGFQVHCYDNVDEAFWGITEHITEYYDV